MPTVYLNAATGNDANSYAQAQNPATPWLTVNKVESTAVTGDSVVMAAGTYTFASVTFTKAFTWTGAALVNGLPTTILDGAAGVVRWYLSATTTISNVMFQNALSTDSNANAALFMHNSPVAATVTFNNCVFKTITMQNQLGKGGLASIGSITSTFIVSFVFNNCAFIDPIKTVGKDGTMFGVDNASQGTNSSFTFNNCVFYFLTSGVSAIVIVIGKWNTCYATVKNCIFYNVTGGTVNFRNVDNTVTLSYSDMYLMSLVPAGTGNITSDPLFVDAANGNFNLRPTSPCLDTGVIV